MIESIENRYRYFGAGGARGFDTVAAMAVLELKEVYPDIRLILVFPCRNQTRGWRETDIQRYEWIKSKADKVVYTSEHYYNGCMQKRNRHLVDYSSDWGKVDIGGISFTGTPIKPVNWRTVPSDKGTVYCRSVCVTRDENGLPLALESFDMLPITKKDMSKNIGTEENPDWVWMKNEVKDLASASLYVQQTGNT